MENANNKINLKDICFYFLIILAVINSIFLIVNLITQDWVLRLDLYSVLLALLGLLFTFTAINIYSIFNTNVNTEKENLEKLKNDYEDTLQNKTTIFDEKLGEKTSEFDEKLGEKTTEFDNKLREKETIITKLTEEYKTTLEYDRKLLELTFDIERLRTTVHAIANTRQMNGQFLEWIDMAKNQIGLFLEQFKQLYVSLPDDMFDSLLSMTLVVLKDSRYMIEKEKKIIEGIPFWKKTGTGGRQTRESAIEDLEYILEKIDEFIENNQAVDIKR